MHTKIRKHEKTGKQSKCSLIRSTAKKASEVKRLLKLVHYICLSIENLVIKGQLCK